MLIDLEPAKPGFDRLWVSGGVDEFLSAAHRFFATHANCGEPGSMAHLSVSDPICDVADFEDVSFPDGIHRVWFYCACGRKLLALGPPDGGEMPPVFPRLQ